MASPAQTLNSSRKSGFFSLHFSRLKLFASWPARLRMDLILALVIPLHTPLYAADTILSRHQQEPGIYVWDGLARGSADRLSSSIATLDRKGFHAIRLLLSPGSRREYSLPPSRCPEGRSSLSCLVTSEPFSRALSLKTVDTVMFTAYDFTSFPRQRFLDPQFLKANRQQVFDEYRDLAETLMKQYSGSGRVFIIGHWEGDNQVYCGSSYDFQTDDHKRYACVEQYPEIRLAGLTAWLQIRQEAIAEGRRRAVASGTINVEVYHAVEFNTIFASRKVSGASISSRDYKGVLDTAIPSVHPDVCSYSAWESVNRNRLTKDLQDIQKKCAPAPVIVGEIGDRENPDKRYPKIVSSLQPLKQSIPLVFFWQAFEPAASKAPGFGLFTLDGTALHPKVVEQIDRLHP